jgi:hypothetical protein
MASETWYYIKDGFLYRHKENDGYTVMRRGLEPVDTRLCTVEIAEVEYPKELDRALKDTYGIRQQA